MHTVPIPFGRSPRRGSTLITCIIQLRFVLVCRRQIKAPDGIFRFGVCVAQSFPAVLKELAKEWLSLVKTGTVKIHLRQILDKILSELVGIAVASAAVLQAI